MMFFLSIFALFTLSVSSCEGRVSKKDIEPSYRNLGHHSASCEDIAGFASRCCSEDLSHCEYPFRTWNAFRAYWEHTCAVTASNYAAACLPDIVETAVNAGSFNTLAAALTAADLVGALSAPNGPYTVFAPTDDAFAALPSGLVECLVKPENKDPLTSILLYHVVSGQVLSSDLSDGQVAETLSGEDVVVDLSSGVKINTSPVSTADILASNGVIHVIDSVLVPPSVDVEAFLATCNGAPEPDLPDIVETAVAAGSFNTLATALTAAELVGALSAPNGPYTVFAPTDDAFAALPSGLVECLVKPENKDPLTYILLYHVVNGQVLSSDLSDGQVVETLSGEDAIVDLSSGVMIDSSNVLSADILTSNGVIHVIDSVLVPSSIDVDAFLATC